MNRISFILNRGLLYWCSPASLDHGDLGELGNTTCGAVGRAARSAVQGRGVMHFLVVSVFAGACLLIFHVVHLVVADLPRTAYYSTAIVAIIVVVISLLVVAVKQESEAAATSATSGEAAGWSSSSIMLSNNPPPPPPSSFRLQCYSIVRDVFSVDMVLIFLVTLVIGGGVQTPIDMMDQIGQSLEYKHGTTSKLVSLVSLLDYLGRLVGGFCSDYMVARRNLPRPEALTVAFLLACFGHLLIALGVRNGLYAAAAIMGFCIGALRAVVFVTISEVFGTKHLAALYNLAVLPSAIGSYILNLQVTGRLYDGDGAQRQGRPDHHTCASVQCFRKFFFVLVGVTLLGAVVSAMLAWRVSPFYRAPTPIGGGAAAVGVVASVTADRGSGEVEAVSSIKLEVAAMDVESFV